MAYGLWLMAYETYKKSVLLQASIFLANPFWSHWLNGRREVEGQSIKHLKSSINKDSTVPNN